LNNPERIYVVGDCETDDAQLNCVFMSSEQVFFFIDILCECVSAYKVGITPTKIILFSVKQMRYL
jgi:hypothetical protein